MTTTARSTSAPDLAATDDRLPWPSLLVLGAATLVMVTTEMLPTAVLAPMSVGLGVTETRTAALVSVWATVVVLSSFPLVRLTRGRNRRNVIGVGLVVLAASSVLTALAPTYPAALGARLVGAAAVGLLWATVNAHVADLVSDRLLGTAVAVVLGGATLGMVLGTPVARLVSDAVGWRASFGGLAAVGLLAATAVRLVVASTPRVAADQSLVAEHVAARASLRAMVATTGLVALWLVGHYAAYTFITRLAEAPADQLPGGIGTVLLLFGIASAAGVAAAGRLGRYSARALAAFAGLTAVAVLALTVVDRGVALGLTVVVVWGLVSGAVPPLAQTEILRSAGPAHRSTAGALIPVLFNGGIAIGAALGSVLVGRAGIGALPLPTAAVIAAAALGIGVTVARRSAR